jgi:hypothetical protein
MELVSSLSRRTGIWTEERQVLLWSASVRTACLENTIEAHEERNLSLQTAITSPLVTLTGTAMTTWTIFHISLFIFVPAWEQIPLYRLVLLTA